MATSASNFDPNSVDLDTADPTDIVCYLSGVSTAQAEDTGRVGARIAAIFVILVVSTACTLFPVVASRVRWLRIPRYGYLFARYFGAGVIVATAFVHLLDPAYKAIGPNTCVGMTGGWANFSWPPAIALTSIMVVFLMDFGAERYVDKKFGLPHGNTDASLATKAPTRGNDDGVDAPVAKPGTVPTRDCQSHQFLHSGDQDMPSLHSPAADRDTNIHQNLRKIDLSEKTVGHLPDRMLDVGLADADYLAHVDESGVQRAFMKQISAFLVLEFGVIFHSIIIGLNLGVVGDEFGILFPVITIHQAFEGLGIGARLSSIPFPRKYYWLPWALCFLYGITTPVAISFGLGLRAAYTAESFTANVVAGVFDAMSAGILVYTGLVELLARDFLFNPERTDDSTQLTFMLGCVLLGVALMALLGKWA